MLEDQQIADAYRFFLGREPDAAGLAHYRAMGRDGLTLDALHGILLVSEEYRRGRPRHRIAAMFALAYERAPTEEELVQLSTFIDGIGVANERDLLKAVVSAFSRTSHPTSVGVRLSHPDVKRIALAELDANLVLDRFDWWAGNAIGAGDYEPHLADFIRRVLEPGMVAVDVGANVGRHMLTMSRLVGQAGHIYAFEPNSENCRALMLTIRENDLSNVELIPVALSDRTGAIAFTQAIGGNGGFLYFIDDPVLHPNCSVVPTIPLDTLIDPARLDFIKVDVEGAEHLVISGAMGLIRKHRPVIVTEFSVDMLSGASRVAPQDYLRRYLDMGYRARTLGLSGPVEEITDPDAWLSNRHDRFRIDDIAFVPAERAEILDR